MLNISSNKIKDRIPFSGAKSLIMTLPEKESQKRIRLLVWLIAILFISLFLPWTQSIRSKGYVTALKPEQRAQTIHSVIAGRIEKWYVSEGAFVNKGDTILRISEIKDEYFYDIINQRKYVNDVDNWSIYCLTSFFWRHFMLFPFL